MKLIITLDDIEGTDKRFNNRFSELENLGIKKYDFI